MSKHAFAAFSVLLAGVGLSGGSLAAVQPRAASDAGPPIIYGYPYAEGCPGAGLADIVDRWGMYACNCTSFVAWALSANHQRTDWFIGGSMDAWNWPNVARMAKLTVDRTASIGAIAVWPNIARPFGHVAYVTRVDPGRTIDVAEYNFPGPNGRQTFGFETRRFVPAGGAVFIHVPRRTLSRVAGAEPLR
jgi:surface antigen